MPILTDEIFRGQLQTTAEVTLAVDGKYGSDKAVGDGFYKRFQ